MDEKREITRPLWLFLLREGGRWNAGELAKRLSLDGTQARAALRQMFERGMVLRHVPAEYGKTLAYEVDDSCRLPDNLRLADLRDAALTCGCATAKMLAASPAHDSLNRQRNPRQGTR